MEIMTFYELAKIALEVKKKLSELIEDARGDFMRDSGNTHFKAAEDHLALAKGARDPVAKYRSAADEFLAAYHFYNDSASTGKKPKWRESLGPAGITVLERKISAYENASKAALLAAGISKLHMREPKDARKYLSYAKDAFDKYAAAQEELESRKFSMVNMSSVFVGVPVTHLKYVMSDELKDKLKKERAALNKIS